MSILVHSAGAALKSARAVKAKQQLHHELIWGSATPAISLSGCGLAVRSRTDVVARHSEREQLAPSSDLPPEKARAAVAAAARHQKAVAGAEESAEVLARFLGLPPGSLPPASVLDLDQEQVLGILEAVWRRADPVIERALYGHAAAVTTKFTGGQVYYRGLVEFSNICQNDCGYCGIRSNQKDVWRYTMPKEEVVDVAKWAFENGIYNVMLQSGELRTEQRIEYLEDVVKAIRAETVAMDLAKRAKDGTPIHPNDELGVAVSLSVGELPIEIYERFFKAGARRYLIRIETSNPELYAKLHPAPLDWHQRVQCIRDLKKVGYMLGTGVMVGLPGQTLRDLASDVMFFKNEKADMIGMGPFILQEGTPVTSMWHDLYPNKNKVSHMKSMFELTTAMNALVRITMGNVNISATTAMQAIIPTGREIALERGANVVMPILTPTKYRESYQLYEGKPCITDTAVQCRACLDMRLKFAGKTAAPSVWGDPQSYLTPLEGVHIPKDLGVAPYLEAVASADFHEDGASPWSPIPLERNVHVPEDDMIPPSHPHGSNKKKTNTNGKAATMHDSHDDHDHDDHHHGHDDHHAHAHGGEALNNVVPREAASTSRKPTAVSAAARQPTRLFGSSLRSRARMVVPRSAGRWACPSMGFAGSSTHATACKAVAAPPGSNGMSAPEGIASTTAHGLPRINIGVFGKMNAGKSTLVNILAQQETCIVDSTPGTTADVKTVLLELHGLGPSKILDTAGLDEAGVLGEKKRRKALNTLKECDVGVIVVDTEALLAAKAQPGYDVTELLKWERMVLEQSAKYGVSPILLVNIKNHARTASMDALLEEVRTTLDPSGKIPARAYDLSGIPRENHLQCADFVKTGAVRSIRWGKPMPGCLPRWSLGKGSMVLMVIPMDAETPGGRLLRPQAMVQEEAIRQWATVFSVRLDLDAARGKLGLEAKEAEYQRFSGVVQLISNNPGPALIVTDSQAVDIVHPWTLDKKTGKPLAAFTTFSIAMAYNQNVGNLTPFVEGVEALTKLKEGDRVLIAEACNHTRITDNCNDIGMVQIPNKLKAMAGGANLQIDHNFGREFADLESGKLGSYDVVIHCGGCMIDTQKMQQRMHDLGEAHVPVVNYGTFFSWATSPEALQRALEPWGVEPPQPMMP